jgi:cytochrome P450
VAGQGRLDVIRDLADPLPSLVIGEVLGIPSGERERFKRLVENQAFKSVTTRITPADYRRPRDSFMEVDRLFRALIDERRRAPRQDLLSLLLARPRGATASARTSWWPASSSCSWPATTPRPT